MKELIMSDNKTQNQEQPEAQKDQAEHSSNLPKEHGGPKGPEPTRYGDWEQNGKCVDF